MTSTFILDLIYLIGSVTFILGLKMLSNPEKARTGNLIAAAGMTLAIIATIIFVPIIKGISISPTIYGLLAGGIVIGTVIGWMVAKKVKMTAMPQLVSLFNGMGGACAALISLIEFGHALEHGSLKILITIMAGLIIGSVSFSGSMIAFLKLNGNLGKDIRLPMYNLINNIILLATVGFAGYLVFMSTGPAPMTEWPHLLMFSFVALALALFYGIMFVLPIGGADMPVVISLLNSFTGLAAAAGGFLYHNQVMLTGGILVGSAGTLLTVAMCEGMNRSLFSVIFGAFGGGGATAAVAGATGGSIKDISVADTAVLMNYSKKVVIVPGYGLAVAQAQHVMHELEVLLEERGVEVKYAIHPVAGRMPGHMNVLMAECNVDYSKLVEMEDINPEFETTDVVFIVGANDVVNPAAKTNPASPIYGMPILEVEKAKNIIVNKRSMNPGYAGIDNELFYSPKTSMLFGDAKKVVTDLVAELKTM